MKMKKFLSMALFVGVITVGCSKEEELTGAPSSAGGGVSISDPQAASPTSPSSSQPTLDLDPSKFGPPPPAIAVDFSATTAEERPRNVGGKQMSDLEYLNQLLEELATSRFNYVPSPESAPYKNDEEREAYEAKFAELKKKLQAPITDINELVKAGVIKAIPAAPTGQKYVINATTQKIELVAQ